MHAIALSLTTSKFAIAIRRGPGLAFLPLRLDLPWRTGEVLDLRVRSLRGGGQGGGFCEDLSGQAYFLRRTQGLTQGQAIRGRVISEARGTKNALVEVTQEGPGPATLSACLQQFGVNTPIQVEGLDALKNLRTAFPKDRFELTKPQDALRHQALDFLELETRDVSAEAEVLFESAETAHLIDVNTQGEGDRANLAALPALATGIAARNWGGIILIDFLPPATKDQRRDLSQRLETALGAWPHRLKLHTMNESGHLIIERQRLGPEFDLSYFGNAL